MRHGSLDFQRQVCTLWAVCVVSEGTINPGWSIDWQFDKPFQQSLTKKWDAGVVLPFIGQRVEHCLLNMRRKDNGRIGQSKMKLGQLSQEQSEASRGVSISYRDDDLQVGSNEIYFK